MRITAFSLTSIFALLSFQMQEGPDLKFLQKHSILDSTYSGTLSVDEKLDALVTISEQHVKVNFVNPLPTLHRETEINIGATEYTLLCRGSGFHFKTSQK